MTPALRIRRSKSYLESSVRKPLHEPEQLHPIQCWLRRLKQRSKRPRKQPKWQDFRRTSPLFLPIIFVTQRGHLLTYRSRWPSKARDCWILLLRLVRRMQPTIATRSRASSLRDSRRRLRTRAALADFYTAGASAERRTSTCTMQSQPIQSLPTRFGLVAAPGSGSLARTR